MTRSRSDKIVQHIRVLDARSPDIHVRSHRAGDMDVPQTSGRHMDLSAHQSPRLRDSKSRFLALLGMTAVPRFRALSTFHFQLSTPHFALMNSDPSTVTGRRLPEEPGSAKFCSSPETRRSAAWKADFMREFPG